MNDEIRNRIEELVDLLSFIDSKEDVKQYEVTDIGIDDKLPCVELLVNGVQVELYWNENSCKLMNPDNFDLGMLRYAIGSTIKNIVCNIDDVD